MKRHRAGGPATTAVSDPAQIPSFDGATAWLNTEPLGPTDLRGHVVLVDFWTFTCINWLRTAPYTRAWWEAYRDEGLVVIGVHTPEFSFEHEIERVRDAIAERGISYPVAIDNDYAIWSAFNNHYWPSLYTMDESGIVRDYHPGELRYGHPERVIQKLLGVERDLVSVEGSGVEAPADWRHLRSPETYLGSERGRHFVASGGARFGERHAYELPRRFRSDHWGLAGEWTIGGEQVTLEEARGRIALRFHARDAHLVLSRRSASPVTFSVLLDGEVPGSSHGTDVDEQGNGILREGRMYQLVRQAGEVRERTLEITFGESGVEAYVFTFG